MRFRSEGAVGLEGGPSLRRNARPVRLRRSFGPGRRHPMKVDKVLRVGSLRWESGSRGLQGGRSLLGPWNLDLTEDVPPFRGHRLARFVSAVPVQHGVDLGVPPGQGDHERVAHTRGGLRRDAVLEQDRKSTRLNSSHTVISYAVFCLKKK